MVVVSDLEDAGHGFCSVFAAFLQRFLCSIIFWRNGALSWDTGQQVDHGAR